MYRDGEEGHIGVRIRGDMEFNNRRNVFAHKESQVVIDYLSKHYCNLSFLNYCFVKTLPSVFSASTSEMAATDSVESGCGLACRQLGFAM